MQQRAGTVRAPGGGRCMRARELARRRAGGKELGDYEMRLLDAHLTGCGRLSPVRRLAAGEGNRGGTRAGDGCRWRGAPDWG
jgi:hypothetical protein